MGSCWPLLLLLFIEHGASNLPGSAPGSGDPSHAYSTEGPSCPVQSTSGVGTTPGTAPSPSNPTCSEMESSVLPGSKKAAIITNPPALNTSGNNFEPSGSMTTTVSETSPLTTSSTTLDKVTHMNESSPMTTMTTSAVIHTASSSTTTLGTSVLGTTMSGTQEGETTAAPPTPATTPTMSKSSDSHHDTATQTPSQPVQSTSGVGTTPRTAPSPSKPTSYGMESSLSPGSEKAATITTPPAFNTRGNNFEPSGSMTTTISETSPLTTSSTTLDKVTHMSESSPMTTMTTSAVIHTASPSTTTLGTSVLGTTMSGTQEGETTAAPPTPATTPTMSKSSDSHHDTATQTPSQPVQSTSGVGTTPGTAPSPSKPTSSGMESSLFPGSDRVATITTPPALNTLGNNFEPSGSMTTTVSETSPLTTSSTTSDEVTHMSESSPMTTMTTSAVIHTASPSTTTLGTNVLGTTMSGTQEGETTAAPPTPATTPTMSKSSDSHHDTATQTPSQPMQSTSGVGTTPHTAPSPSKPTSNGMESSLSPGSEKAATITTPPAFNTRGNNFEPFGSMTTTISETSPLTTSSTTLDKVTHMSESSPMTTGAVIHTASPSTTTLGTSVLGTTMSGTQEGETTAAPPTPATTPTMSKSSDSHHDTATQTPSQPVQSTSGVGTTPGTAPSPSKPTSSGMESSMFPGSDRVATITTPPALNTRGNNFEPSGSMTTTVSETSPLTTSSTMLDKVTHMSESSPMTTGAVIHTASPSTTTLGTSVLGTTMSGTKEGETTAAPPTPATTPMMSKSSDSHHNTATQTPSQPVQSTSGINMSTAQSPMIMAAHSTALVPSSSGTTRSSTMTGASQASPEYRQSTSPRAKACALDEYLANTGVCTCNDSYYAHSEPSRELVTLHCWPRNIEVALSSCFLETRHWILMKGAFSGCSSITKMEQGRRVQVFLLEKKEGNCGLRLSTNNSHALYSLEVQLVQVLPSSNNTGSTMLSFSCAYPLVVNISQTFPYQGDSFLYSTIHIPGTGDTNIILSIFTDPQLSTPLQNKTATVGMPLYVVLRATSSDPDRFALVANEVFASTDISKTEAVKAAHHFVNKSCPVSGRLLQDLQANGASLQVTLAFKLFRFFNSNTLYLHARVTLCDKKAGHSCQPTCSLKNPLGRNSPREIREREGLERDSRWIVFGPLRISESKASSSRSSTGAWMAIFLLMVIGWMLGQNSA